MVWILSQDGEHLINDVNIQKIDVVKKMPQSSTSLTKVVAHLDYNSDIVLGEYQDFGMAKEMMFRLFIHIGQAMSGVIDMSGLEQMNPETEAVADIDNTTNTDNHVFDIVRQTGLVGMC